MSTQLTLENFQQIYNTSYQRVLRYIICKCSNMEDVNDLIQDTYIELYRNIQKKGKMKLDNYTNYIIGIAKKRIIRHYGLLYRFSFISLNQEETDDKAYKDAYNKYEHEKYKYDKKQQEINAKTSIIQQEDKNLELKLTRLDNERNAVNTEIEAVKKVVNDNIEKSFKTFSG